MSFQHVNKFVTARTCFYFQKVCGQTSQWSYQRDLHLPASEDVSSACWYHGRKAPAV